MVTSKQNPQDIWSAKIIVVAAYDRLFIWLGVFVSIFFDNVPQ